ncbi:N,N-dimethylformamidase beta subunit family domain-containing protein [Caulobacter sp. 73W]|uniref:N,N-dimethylformamidase beta subunit family domain-containing protein n=1 Tax=Caulobacter sp. 73W TaxID=3161137 RepID=A0AB39KYI8_9CAUL
MPAFYSDRLSARPGDAVSLFISAQGPCRIEAVRIGAEHKSVLTLEGIECRSQPVPQDADAKGCGWSVTTSLTIGSDWRSGYYDLVLTDAAGQVARHFVCVRPPRGERRADAALVLATNTYHAYNWWGGANAYCDVTALMTGKKPFPEAMAGAIGVLSTERPFSSLIVGAPQDAPRLVNMRKRQFQEPPFASDMTWMLANRASPYDGSAGFLNKWEHAFVAWAEAEGYVLDFHTDYDLDAEDDVLAGYACALFVGHSEYWSGKERDQVERFVDDGGGLAILSGNTCFWKVRWEDEGRTYVCKKWRGFEDEADQIDPQNATHLWSHPAFARPEAELTGLSFVFGGYHRLGLCVARGQGGFTIYNDHHWALAGSDLFYGDVIGGDLPLIGYESDGCRFQFGDDGLPRATPMLGVPQDLQIIGLAPCAFGEEAGRGYDPIIPPEKLDVIAKVMFDDDSPAAQAKVLRGHAVLASFKRGAGEVFNTGTTEWAHGLAAKDPFIQVITRNVLSRFGVQPK